MLRLDLRLYISETYIQGSFSDTKKVLVFGKTKVCSSILFHRILCSLIGKPCHILRISKISRHVWPFFILWRILLIVFQYFEISLPCHCDFPDGILVELAVHAVIYFIVRIFKDSIQYVVSQKPFLCCWIWKVFWSLRMFIQESFVILFQIFLILWIFCLVRFLDPRKDVMQHLNFIRSPQFRWLFNSCHRISDIEVRSIIHTSGICGVCQEILTEYRIFLFFGVERHSPGTHRTIPPFFILD